MNRGEDVAVVGAGLIGLAIAFELAERGALVRVFDRGEPGRAASWAGAGMLAPHTEHGGDTALLALCARSLDAYPSFVDRVRDASGIDPHLELIGIVNAAFDSTQYAGLCDHARRLAQRKIAHRLLDRRATLGLEPWLGTAIVGSLLISNEGTVDNRLLGRALAQACSRRGVLIVRNATDLAVVCDERRVLGVRSQLGFAPASLVINAAGAWAGAVQGIPACASPAVHPVKGQMLALAMPRGFVRRPTWVPGAYLVPRDDGRLLIGATVEPGAFECRVTSAGIASLLDAALAAAPALGDFTLTESWAGLRPGTPDGRPYIGTTPIDGLLVATGHYRNGILLAPETARLVAGLAEGSLAASAVADFALGRPKPEAGHAERMIGR